MNIYDTKQIKCSVCGKSIGEINYNSSIIFPLCGACEKKEKQTLRNGIQKILVPIDMTKKSTRALDAAIYLAKHLGSSITVMQVIPAVTMRSTSFSKDISKVLSKDAEESTRWAKEYCENKNIIVTHKIVKGDEAEGILKTAKEFNYDLIIMGSSGKGVFKELVVGSISNYVMHNSNIPVLIIKEESVKLDTKIKQNKKKTKTRHKSIRGGEGQKVPLSKMKQKIKSKRILQ